MKLKLSLLLFSFTSFTFAQLQVNTLNIITNDLVYDEVTNKIYASIPSANGDNGNSIGIINPNTFSLEKTIFIGSEPTVLAISDNGKYIYSGFSGASIVRRFDVTNQTASLQFNLGSDPTKGSYYVEDIEVMPNMPTTIAISRKNNGFSPRHEGVVIYDNNVMRPVTTPYHTGSNRIEFTSKDSIIGYNNESTEFGLRRIEVNSNGVSNVSVTKNILSNFFLDFIYNDKHLYSTDGKVVDISGEPYVKGKFTNVSGPVVFDNYNNKVCYASFDFSGNITFKRYNPNTFLLTDSFPITQASGNVKKIISCGNGCYAFNNADKIVFIKETTLGIFNQKEKNNLIVFPNPTSDFLFINSELKIKEIQITDLNGKSINQIEIYDNKINLYNLQSGIYLVKITDINNETWKTKFIKN